MITNERLQAELDLGYKSLCSQKGEELEAHVSQFLVQLRDTFADLIQESGDVSEPKQLDSLCLELQRAQRQLEAVGVPAEIVKRVDELRKDIRKRLRLEEGWEKPPGVGLDVLNRARSAMGLSKIFKGKGNEYFTEEEMRAMQALFLELGDIAAADFAAAEYSNKFNFNNRQRFSLRPYIGDIETYGGNPIEDIPVQLLTLPKHADLRALLFNHYRDKHLSDYKEGPDVVLGKLESFKARAKEDPRKQFIEELIQFFGRCEAVQCHERLRKDFGPDTEFPEKHQRVSAVEIERLKQILIADGTGGGKTGSAIAGFEHLRAKKKAKRALIICPTEVVGVWEKALSDSSQGLFQKGKTPNKVVIRAGDEDRGKSWEDAKSADYVVMSIAMTRQSTDGMSHEELAQQIGADYFIIDEAHNVRSPQSERKRKGQDSEKKSKMTRTDAERIFRISQCDTIRDGYTVSMTATPIFNTILDLATQLRLLNAGQDRTRGGEIPEGIDFHNIQSLARSITCNHTRLVRNLLRLRMLHRTTQECLPVGTKLEIEPPMKVKMHPLARACYDAIVEDPFYTANEKLEILRSLCVRLPRDGQMTGSGEAKYHALCEKTDQYFGELRAEGITNGKILVMGSGPAKGVTRDFSGNKDPDTSAVNSYLAGRQRRDYKMKGIPVIILDGDDTDSRPLPHPEHGGEWLDADGASMTKTRRIIAGCRDHQGEAEFFTRTDVSGQGIDLSFTHRLINLHPYFTSSEDDQGIGRVHRRGQKRDVKVCTLITEDSIEEGIAQFASYKRRIIEDVMQGRPLTAFEERMLFQNARKVREGGLLAYNMLTPAQKVMWILGQIKQKGKGATREFFAFDDGRFAKDLAANYVRNEELTTSGNCARLLEGLVSEYMPELQALAKKSNVQAADIASGPLTMARALKDDKKITVWSSDIEPAMLEMGKHLVGISNAGAHVQECAMDELSYAPNSKHLAFISLALHYTYHSRRKKDRTHISDNVLAEPGGERVRTLTKLNSILAEGGLAFITLPDSLFKDEEKFGEFCRVLREFFGFEVIQETTGLAQSMDRNDEEKFSAYVLTLRKIGPTCEKEMTKLDDWKALAFSHRVSSTSPHKERKLRFIDEKPSSSAGSFHEIFSIRGKQIVHKPSSAQEEVRKLHEEGKRRHERLSSVVSSLVKEHGSIQKIPNEKLLSISLVELDESEQREKDTYFRELLRRYNGRVEDIPIEDISKKSPIILVRGSTKRKGPFICLALLENEKKSPKPRGKRYFYESEF